MRKLLSREVGMLLKSNSSQEQHQWLLRHFEFGKMFDPSKVNFTDHEISIYENNIEHILTMASAEWELRDEYPLDELEDETAICSICGNNQNKKIFYIKNRVTGEEINIGSECRTHFGIKGNIPIAQLERELRKDKQRNKLSQHIPDIDHKALYWEKAITQFSIVIPKQYVTPFLSACKSIKDTYTEFLESKNDINDDLPDFFKEQIKTGEIWLDKMQKYVDEMANKPDVASRSVWQWLKYRPQSEAIAKVINDIEENGMLPWNHVWRITEQGLMNQLIPRINKVSSSLGVNFDGIDSTSVGDGKYVISIKMSNGNDLKYSCGHGFLFMELGDVLLGIDKPPIKRDFLGSIVKGINPYSQNDYNELNRMLYTNLPKEFRFEHKYDNEDTGELAILDRTNNLYAMINENKLVQLLLPFLFDIETETFVHKKLASLKWEPENILKNRIEISKAMKRK